MKWEKAELFHHFLSTPGSQGKGKRSFYIKKRLFHWEKDVLCGLALDMIQFMIKYGIS
ncbi:hypothetical protein [Bacillus sonorensis]|uniref:hypothetical protein n=1 Tax=Bacillus sonorensis TaxID=119858 RepID=UPI00227F7A74|nr:hypothetical protein [Bacillus sonorensis]MCY8606708.1 hypothetical protein [Bacillus sonorensis]